MQMRKHLDLQATQVRELRYDEMGAWLVWGSVLGNLPDYKLN